MEEDLILIEKIKSNKNQLIHIYNQYRNYCINFIRKENNGCLSEDELFSIYTHSVAILYNKITTSGFTLTSRISTFLTAIFKIQFLKVYTQLQRNNQISINYVDNFDYISSILYSADEDENHTLLSQKLEVLGNSDVQCYKILKLYYFQGYSITKITTKLKYKSDDSTKSQKSKCKKKLEILLFN